MEREARSKPSKVVRGDNWRFPPGLCSRSRIRKAPELSLAIVCHRYSGSRIHGFMYGVDPARYRLQGSFGAAISKVVRFPPHLQTPHRASQKETSVPLLLVAGYRVDHQVLYYIAMTAAVGRALVSFHVCWARLPRICFRGRSVGLDQGHACWCQSNAAKVPCSSGLKVQVSRACLAATRSGATRGLW